MNDTMVTTNSSWETLMSKYLKCFFYMSDLLSVCHLSHCGRCYELSICHHTDITDTFLYVSHQANYDFNLKIALEWFWKPGQILCISSTALQPCGTMRVRYLAGHPVWTEFSKAEGRLDSPQQSHNIQMLYPPPENSTDATLVILYITSADIRYVVNSL